MLSPTEEEMEEESPSISFNFMEEDEASTSTMQTFERLGLLFGNISNDENNQPWLAGGPIS